MVKVEIHRADLVGVPPYGSNPLYQCEGIIWITTHTTKKVRFVAEHNDLNKQMGYFWVMGKEIEIQDLQIVI